jgi:hypothetical protein
MLEGLKLSFLMGDIGTYHSRRAKLIYPTIDVYVVGKGRRPSFTSYIIDFCLPPSYSTLRKAYSLPHPSLVAECQSEKEDRQ